MKKTGTILFLLFLTALQVASQEVNLEQEQLEFNLNITQCQGLFGGNKSTLKQDGLYNDLYLQQEQEGEIINLTQVTQNGNNNDAYIYQEGQGHITAVKQINDGNEANLWSVGHLTVTLAKQQGEGNFINSYISNENLIPKAAVLIQEGNNNKIEFALLGNGFLMHSWPKAAYIKQTGNELEISAVFESYSSPIYIEQQSGTNGGMKIDVSNSDFSFPMKNQ